MKVYVPSLVLSMFMGPLSLQADPKKPTEHFHELAVQRPEGVEELFNALTPQERIEAYFLYRASIPGNRILSDQHHRHALAILEIFEHLYSHRSTLLKQKNGQEFVDQIKLFLVYLWSDHGHYFVKESENNKRTPSNLNLNLISPESLVAALRASGFVNAQESVERVRESLFNASNEPSLSVSGSIEKSAVNIYAPEFTQAHYDGLKSHRRGQLNAYYYLDAANHPQVGLYSTQEKYAEELQVSSYWFQKAFDWAQGFPKEFDEHFVASLMYLIGYLKTGDEELFKEHSRAWLKSHSRVDYTFGFIETYDDPMGKTGMMEAELTVKNYSLETLTSMLPGLEGRLPMPHEFKRENRSVLPNASINTQLFGAGQLGPFQAILAYCLPNDDEIRSKDGSKQVIYPAEKRLEEALNPELTLKLFKSVENQKWHQAFDPDLNFPLAARNLMTTLHETIGHASGRLSHHVFKEGEPLTLANTTYKVGDSIPLTSGLLAEILVGYESSLEELRAEIIALYIAVNHIEEIAAQGFLTQWYKTLGKEQIQARLILVMAYKGIARLFNQKEDTQQIVGAHAQANTTIMNYLIDKGALELVEESTLVEGKTYPVYDLRMIDFERAKQLITDLMQEVQRIKSTADRQSAHQLIDHYGKRARTEIIKTVKNNLKVIVGNLRGTTVIYPFYQPIYSEGALSDVILIWPNDFFEANMKFSELALSKEDDVVFAF